LLFSSIHWNVANGIDFTIGSEFGFDAELSFADFNWFLGPEVRELGAF